MFYSISHHEVMSLGLEFIGFWSIYIKYINCLMIYTHYVFSSYPSIRRVKCTLLSWAHSTSDLCTIFDCKFDLDDSRWCFRHLSTPTHRPGPFEHLKFRIFIKTLPRSSKSWFSVKLKLKETEVVTNYFNDKLFWIFPRLIGTQLGLSITTLSVEKSLLQITHMIIYILMEDQLNRDYDSWENRKFPFWKYSKSWISIRYR